MRRADQCIAQEKRWSADNYASLPVVLSRGLGAEAWDIEGKRYLDFMGAYSAANLEALPSPYRASLTEQACTLGVVSRAFHNDKLGAFLQKACETTGMDRALPMNSGAEAVETALKAARKWAYEVRACPTARPRSSAARAISTAGPRASFPCPLPTGRARATDRTWADSGTSRSATPMRWRRPSGHTAAFLVEPIQGEAGIIVPPPGYLRACADLCRRHNVLFSSPTRYRPDWDAPATCSRARRTMRVPTALCLARRWAAAWSRFPVPGAARRDGRVPPGRPRQHVRRLSSGGCGGPRSALCDGRRTALPTVPGNRRRAEGRLAGRRWRRCATSGRGLMIGVGWPAPTPRRARAHALLERGVLCKTWMSTIRLAPPLNIPCPGRGISACLCP